MDLMILQGSWEHPGDFILRGARMQLVLMVRQNPGDVLPCSEHTQRSPALALRVGRQALTELLACCIDSKCIDQVASSLPLQTTTRNSLSGPPYNRVAVN